MRGTKEADSSPASEGKAPRTARGERTLRKILDAALEAFLEFASTHKHVYRIIDEAEWADPEAFEKHYRTTAARIAARLDAGKAKGEVKGSDSRLASEVEAWAIMGMNVFLGLRFAVWGKEKPADVASVANRMIRKGLER